MLGNMRQLMESHGAGPVTSTQQGYLQLWEIVERQAAILSYLDAFMLLSGLFVLLIPLIFVMKRPARSESATAAAAAH
jgi:DHA2 family multidrug resistance protein